MSKVLVSVWWRDIALEFIETGKASVLNDSIELITYNIKGSRKP
jgi:hypothetical protein